MAYNFLNKRQSAIPPHLPTSSESTHQAHSKQPTQSISNVSLNKFHARFQWGQHRNGPLPRCNNRRAGYGLRIQFAFATRCHIFCQSCHGGTMPSDHLCHESDSNREKKQPQVVSCVDGASHKRSLPWSRANGGRSQDHGERLLTKHTLGRLFHEHPGGSDRSQIHPSSRERVEERLQTSARASRQGSCKARSIDGSGRSEVFRC